MEREISRFERQEKEGLPHSLYVVKLDLDFFKQINDSFGHAMGDLYLQKVSEHMSKKLRKTDTLARVGGDEFVVLMPGLGSDHAEQITERLLNAVRDGSAGAKTELERQRPNLMLKDADGNISASIGFALFDGHESSREFIGKADYYSYVAKAAGKNMVVGSKLAAELDPDGKIYQAFTAAKEVSK